MSLARKAGQEPAHHRADADPMRGTLAEAAFRLVDPANEVQDRFVPVCRVEVHDRINEILQTTPHVGDVHRFIVLDRRIHCASLLTRSQSGRKVLDHQAPRQALAQCLAIETHPVERHVGILPRDHGQDTRVADTCLQGSERRYLEALISVIHPRLSFLKRRIVRPHISGERASRLAGCRERLQFGQYRIDVAAHDLSPITGKSKSAKNVDLASGISQNLLMASLTPALLRAARALLDWSQEELAERAGVGWSTVRDFESGRRQLRRTSHDAIVGALASQVVFFGENEVSPHGGPGVRLAGSDPQPAISGARVQTSRRPPGSSRKPRSARTVPDDPPRDRPASTDAEIAARFALLDELSLKFQESRRRLDEVKGKSGSDDAT